MSAAHPRLVALVAALLLVCGLVLQGCVASDAERSMAGETPIIGNVPQSGTRVKLGDIRALCQNSLPCENLLKFGVAIDASPIVDQSVRLRTSRKKPAFPMGRPVFIAPMQTVEAPLAVAPAPVKAHTAAAPAPEPPTPAPAPAPTPAPTPAPEPPTVIVQNENRMAPAAPPKSPTLHPDVCTENPEQPGCIPTVHNRPLAGSSSSSSSSSSSNSAESEQALPGDQPPGPDDQPAEDSVAHARAFQVSHTNADTGTYRTCYEAKIREPSLPSGEYVLVDAATQQSFRAYCDMVTDGGGWMLAFKQSNFGSGGIASDAELRGDNSLLAPLFDSTSSGSIMEYGSPSEALFKTRGRGNRWLWFSTPNRYQQWGEGNRICVSRLRHMFRVGPGLRLWPDTVVEMTVAREKTTSAIMIGRAQVSDVVTLAPSFPNDSQLPQCLASHCSPQRHGRYEGDCQNSQQGYGDWLVFVR